MAFKRIDKTPRYQCLSTDVKTTVGIDAGSTCKETNTGAEYTYSGTAWFSSKQTLTHTAVTVGAATTATLAANANRKYALIINDSDSTIYPLKIGAAAVLSEGIRLNAGGGSYEMSVGYGNLDTRVINAISSGAGKVLLVTEGV